MEKLTWFLWLKLPHGTKSTAPAARAVFDLMALKHRHRWGYLRSPLRGSRPHRRVSCMARCWVQGQRVAVTCDGWMKEGDWQLLLLRKHTDADWRTNAWWSCTFQTCKAADGSTYPASSESSASVISLQKIAVGSSTNLAISLSELCYFLDTRSPWHDMGW